VLHPRHAIKDVDWERIKHLLAGQPGQHGKAAKDNRLFIDAVLWIAKTGAPWRDLPARFGPWTRSCGGSTAGPARGCGSVSLKPFKTRI
jgi:transposase